MFDGLIEFFKELTKVRSVEDLISLITRKIGELLGGLVMHYGCPNSNRTRKLQLKKRLYR